MKGWLRGVVAVGVLAGGVLGVGCKPADMGPRTDANKSPVQEKYQAPSADEAQPLGDQRMQHPEQQQKQQGR
jgi:hypothetical protein